MEPITISTAIGYILKTITQTKVAKTAENELLKKLWSWVKPHVNANEAKEIEAKPNDPKTKAKLESHLTELSKNKNFAKKLEVQISNIKKEEIKRKNITGEISNVEDIHIGDLNSNAAENWDEKNITGHVSKAKKFVLGDGHKTTED